MIHEKIISALKEHKYKYFEFNVNVTHLGYHFYFKDTATLCAHGCTMEPHNNSVCLHPVWYTGNLKSNFLHDVAGEKMCGCSVTGINPVSSGFPAF